jgi:trehalose 6-phosphate synthase
VSRLVVVSNRVAPITEGEAAAGGLAVGVLDALRAKGGIWFGWSGEIAASGESAANAPRAVGAIALATVDLSRKDYDEFYRGFANGTLWPTLHYQIGLGRFDWTEFAGYRRVNTLFARCANRMGLFLHTPFPAPPVLMTVPSHGALVRAMCQYDVLGFQTEADRTAFVDYVTREAGGRALVGRRVAAFGRVVKTGVYPIGVHVTQVRREAAAAANARQATQLRASLLDGKLILSVDRLDYSKGLRQRFGAFERFLQDYPAWRGAVTFMQIAPPSRSDIQTYREIRRELEAEAGRINGRFAEVDWVPLRYLNRSFPRGVLMPLYAEARIGLVTPLRDGMNLVAKEYVAAQDPDDPGVLVLSQFAGAARELDAALIVNPYDESGIAAALDQGLSMPLAERRQRHSAMVKVMRRNSLDAWRDRFEADLRG